MCLQLQRSSSAAVQQFTSRGQEFLFHEVLKIQIFVLQVQAQELLHHRPAPVGNRLSHIVLLCWFSVSYIECSWSLTNLFACSSDDALSMCLIDLPVL